jgi:hypothetical protein
MKHSQRIAKINKESKPLGYRKITVNNKIFWWKPMSGGEGVNILDSNRKPFYSDYWGGRGTITPKWVAQWIHNKLSKPKGSL